MEHKVGEPPKVEIDNYGYMSAHYSMLIHQMMMLQRRGLKEICNYIKFDHSTFFLYNNDKSGNQLFEYIFSFSINSDISSNSLTC